jgi:hypothetical protein
MIMGCIVRSSDLTGQEEGRRGRIANSASIPCVAPDPNRVAEHRVRAYGVVEHKQVGSCAHPTAQSQVEATGSNTLEHTVHSLENVFSQHFLFMRRICSISLHNYGYGAYCTSSDLTRTRRRTTGDMSPTRHPLHAWRLTLTESAERRARAYGVVEHKQVGSRAHPTAPVVSRGDRLRYAGYAGVYCTQFRK